MEAALVPNIFMMIIPIVQMEARITPVRYTPDPATEYKYIWLNDGKIYEMRIRIVRLMRA